MSEPFTQLTQQLATIFLIIPADFHYHKFSFSFGKIEKAFAEIVALVSRNADFSESADNLQCK